MRAKQVLIAIAAPVAIVALGYIAWLLATGTAVYRPPVVGAVDDLAAAAGHPWRGAVHVHSELSGDAIGTVEEIAAAAAQAGLDFVVLADHTRASESTARSRPAWHGSVLVFSAEELSTTAGHLLVFGIRRHRYALGPEVRQALDDVAELDGQAFIAHPEGGELAWTAGIAGARGYEVVSYSGSLHRSDWARRLATILAYPVNPQAAALHVFAAPSPALQRWDRDAALSGNGLPRRLAAIGAVDAHGPLRWLGAPRYAALFGAVSMTVWQRSPPQPENSPQAAARRLTQALLDGRSAIVLNAAGEAPAFDFVARHADRAPVRSGAVASWEPGWRVEASLGAAGEYETVLLRDGEEVAATRGEDLVHAVAVPGTYRAEVYRTDGADGGGRRGATPWVVSNAIYLWPAEAVVAARLRRAPPPPAPPVEDDLLRQPAWAAESDATTRSSMAGNGGGVLWHVRMPETEVGEPYAALAWRPEAAADWSGTRGLAVRLRSTDAWRVGLQLWTSDENDARRVWERVVPSGPGARGAGVRWEELREVEGDEGPGSATPGATDLERVIGVGLVITPARMKTGVEAEIEVVAIGTFGADWPARQ